MSISELSSEEKVKLFEKYNELNEIVLQKEEIDAKMVPFCDKLSNLEDEEIKLNEEYDKIFSLNTEGFSSTNTSKLTEITNRYVEISKEKDELRKQIADLSTKFYSVREEEQNLRDEIEIISNRKQGSIFSANDDVVTLDKNGNVIKSVVVESHDFSKIINKKEFVIKNNRNVITKSSNKVFNIIKQKYSELKTFTFSIGPILQEKVSNFIEKTSLTINEIKEEIKKGYNEEEQRVQDIIDNYNKLKEENKKVEEEAENLQFVSSPSIVNEDTEKEVITNIPLLEDKEAKEEVGLTFVEQDPIILSQDSKELSEATDISLDEVINTIESDNVQENKKKFISDEVDVAENDNYQEQNFNEEKSEIKTIFEQEQFSNVKNNKIAKSTNEKVNNMVKLFETGKSIAKNIGNKVANISSNKKLKQAKKDALKEVNEKNIEELNAINEKYKEMRDNLEQQKQQQIMQSQNNYDNQIIEIENIFSDTAKLAA